MNAIINGMRCPPSFLIMPEYEEYIITKIQEETVFVEVLPYSRSVTFSLIGGGAGGGHGGVQDYAKPSSIAWPGGGSGGGSGYVDTGVLTIDKLLMSIGDSSFESGFKYGFRVEVGAGGTGAGTANERDGANGGASKVYFSKRNASTSEIVSEKLVFENTKIANGGYIGAVTYNGIKDVSGTRGGAGGYGGNGGGKGYSGSNSTDISRMPIPAHGADGYDVNTKKYLFDDPNSKYILGRGGKGGGGFDYQYESWPERGPAPTGEQIPCGSGGFGGNAVYIGNYLAGGNGDPGIVGIRIHYR